MTEKQDRYVPKLDEVKDKVRDEVVEAAGARDGASRRRRELAAKLKGAPDFDKAAKAAGVEAKTTELITRDSPMPDLGVAPAWSRPRSSCRRARSAIRSRPTPAPRSSRWSRSRKSTPPDLTANKDTFREELLTDRRNRFFSAYMVKAKQKMKIEVNREALQRVVG